MKKLFFLSILAFCVSGNLLLSKSKENMLNADSALIKANAAAQAAKLLSDSLRMELEKTQIKMGAELDMANMHRIEPTADVVVPVVSVIATFGSIGFILWIFFTGRSRERLAAIEKGLDKDAANAIFGAHGGARPSSPMIALKWGLLLLGVGIGASVGVIYAEITDGASIFLGCLVGGGAGLVAYYFVGSSKEKAEAKKKIEM